MQEKKEKNFILEFYEGLPFGNKGVFVNHIAKLTGFTSTGVRNKIRDNRWTPLERNAVAQLMSNKLLTVKKNG